MPSPCADHTYGIALPYSELPSRSHQHITSSTPLTLHCRTKTYVVNFCVIKHLTFQIFKVHWNLPQVRAEPFKAPFPELGPPVVPSRRVDHRLAAALESANNILAGGCAAVVFTL